MGDPITSGGFGVWASFTWLVYIGLIMLTIYLMVSTLKFFKHKTQNDQELLQKLDELIKLNSQK